MRSTIQRLGSTVKPWTSPRRLTICNPAAHGRRPFDQLPRVSAVGPNHLEPRKQAHELGQNQLGPVAILDVGRMDHDRQDQTEGIDDDMSFAARDFLARIVSPRPPFSTVLTDWLSMMAAEGVGSLPAWMRTSWRRVS